MNEFHDILQKGTECVSKVPDVRMADMLDYFKNQKIDSTAIDFMEASFLERIDTFDYQFFQYAPADAAYMDPYHRLFLETAWHAIEDAGYMGARIRSTRTGIYLGMGDTGEYKEMIRNMEAEIPATAVIGNLTALIAGRISYLLDLKGVNVNINTSCSSSLTAIHMACGGLRNHDCDMALVGGMNLFILPYFRERIGVESSDFRTKPFDHKADGMGAGEGVGVVLLKPLHKAIEDHDSVYAVIKGSAVNHDGNSLGLTVPNPDAQAEVMIRAWRDAQIEPETITALESHGTGTQLGDPVEMKSIASAFRRFTSRQQFCALGAIKANIGHLGCGAGMASLIKSVLQMQTQTIYPHANYERPNPMIDFSHSPVYINKTPERWAPDSVTRRCGINSFGINGTNAHVVLEEYTAPRPITANREERLIFVLSAREKQSLCQLVEEMYDFLKNNAQYPLRDICYTLATGRSHYEYRMAVIARNRDQLLIALNNVICGDLKEAFMTGRSDLSNDAKEELERQCVRYVMGDDMDWESFYNDIVCYKVHLPGYPFQKTRCWLPGNTIVPKVTVHHHSRVSQIASMMAACLGYETVAADDSFFDLGGDSITGIKLIQDLKNKFGIEMGFLDIVQNPTAAALNEWMDMRIEK